MLALLEPDVPNAIDTTIANLAEISPTLWFNVPRGFDQAVSLFQADPARAARVFARLDLVFYAAAALGSSTRARLEAVAAAAGRSDVFFTSAWGSTETAPLATSAHFPTRTTGILGVPAPGIELALAWVSVSHVRLGIVEACAPHLADVVIAGHDRDALGALVILAPGGSETALAARLAAYNQTHPGASERISRALVLRTPLSLDDGETTDKGYTNQRRVLEHRAVDVARMFAATPDDDVLVLGDPT